jgi:N-methylhydantoinase A
VRLGVDIGGTFTDLAALDPGEGSLRVAKALNQAGHGESGLADVLGAAGLVEADVKELTHATTIVTNLFVERSGATVGLVCSRGFRDVLEIQLSYRERTFDLSYRKTPPLVPRRLRLEIGGRIDATGAEREPIDEHEVEEVLRRLVGEGAESVAVALYNAYANPVHERRVGEIAARVAPRVAVTLSTGVDFRIGEYERSSTAVLNAVAVPTMQRYVAGLASAIASPTRYMHSAGGVVPASEAATRPVQLAFSGPAAGVLAGREVARDLGHENAITMDMGGTTCDVCLVWAGELRHRDRFDVEWGIPARVRSLDIHSIGAGGGSIAWRDSGDALRVGPRSAGAVPGPACYGRGGRAPTVTDANLALGILSPDGLLGGELPLDRGAAEVTLETLGHEFRVSTEEMARAIWSMANANMAQAIREITVRQGIDPRSCVLVAFGGAGPQHAAGVAAELGIHQIAIPWNASVLSALGLLTADIETSSTRTVLVPLERLESDEMRTTLSVLVDDAMARLDLTSADELIVRRFGGLRYVGQSHEVTVALDPGVETVDERFARQHELLYGTKLSGPVEIVDVWVTVTSLVQTRPRGSADAVVATVSEGFERELRLIDAAVPVYQREVIATARDGPCLVEEANSVTFVPAGARAYAQSGHLVLELA